MIIQSTILGNQKIILPSNYLYLTAQYNGYASPNNLSGYHQEDNGVSSILKRYICSENNGITKFTPTIHAHYIEASTSLYQVGTFIGIHDNDNLLGIGFGNSNVLTPIFKLGTAVPSNVNTATMIANEVLDSRMLILGHKSELENTTKDIDYTDSETGYRIVGSITIGAYTNQMGNIQNLSVDIHVYGPDYIDA